MKEFEEIHHWRFYWDFFWCIAPIAAMIYLCEKINFTFYLPCIYLIGNRFYRLSVMGHEGLHHLIHRNKKFNTFLARYFCHFPAFISHSRYKNLHMLHHRFIGTKQDPDLYIFKVYPEPFSSWLKRISFDMLSLRIISHFFEYYSEIPHALRRLSKQKERPLVLVKSDFAQYVLFWIGICVAVTYFTVWKQFSLYWLVPAFFHLPIVQLTNAFQHGGFSEKPKSRSQRDRWWIIDFFIPLDLNYHYEHHLNVRVPHYHLRKYSNYLIATNDPQKASDEIDSTLVKSLPYVFNKKTS